MTVEKEVFRGRKVTNQVGSTSFKCPECGKYEITRTFHERKIATRYKCACGFEGPN
jgi:predicted RNA-binding Zn-ribbon protein involved in translation (DUF1610 family)